MLRSWSFGGFSKPAALRRRALGISPWLHQRGILSTPSHGRLPERYFKVHPEVADALERGEGVVALESTIISHGMPYPTNLSTALSLERIVRDQGAVPATIGIVSGKVHVGLEYTQLERLAEAALPEKKAECVKVSRRDLASTLAQGLDGGTTVSGTMVVAHMAGIQVFATGGIGGVHRGGEKSLDISADLLELCRTPVAVISSGCKSILDIPRTLEYLETMGVIVGSYKSDYFPAFYSPSSGLKAPFRVDSPKHIAEVIYASRAMELSSGAIFGVPIPTSFSQAGLEIEAAVEQAVQESEENGVARRGKEVTPWLLKRVGELTNGKALESNVALVQNNAKVGGQVAVELARLVAAGYQTNSRPKSWFQGVSLPDDTSPVPSVVSVQSKESDSSQQAPEGQASLQEPVLIVVGSAAIDVTAIPSSPGSAISRTTVPGRVSLSLGGVGRNVAEAAHRISTALSDGISPLLISPVGREKGKDSQTDMLGRVLQEGLRAVGMREDGLVPVSSHSDGEMARTPVCNLWLDGRRDLSGGVAEMNIVERMSSTEVRSVLRHHSPEVITFDGNLNSDVMTTLMEFGLQKNARTFFEPTSASKALRILSALKTLLDRDTTISSIDRPLLSFASPNALELIRLWNEARSLSLDLFSHPTWWPSIDLLGLGPGFRTDLDQLVMGRHVASSQKQERELSLLTKDGLVQASVQLLPFIGTLFVKCGSKGVLLVSRQPMSDALRGARTDIAKGQVIAHALDGQSVLVVKHYQVIAPPLEAEEMLSSTGAGDSFVGTVSAALADARLIGMSKGQDPMASILGMDSLMGLGQRAAKMALLTESAVHPNLNTIVEVS